MTDKKSIQREGSKQIRSLLKEMRSLVSEERTLIMNQNPQVTDRAGILFGGIEKLLNMTRVITLITGQRASDEMNVLLRTMVDVTVNICYLQLADDAEVSRYLKYDLVSGKLAMDRLYNATQGNSTLPLEIIERTKKAANKAASQGHLKPNQLEWSKETKNLKQRAEFVDKKIGGYTVVGMYAAIYTMGSGYTHGSYKTIKPYIHWLVDGHTPHELEELYDDSSVLHGVIFVLSIISHYFEWKYRLSDSRRIKILADTETIATILNEDYRRHMADQKTRISTEAASRVPYP